MRIGSIITPQGSTDLGLLERTRHRSQDASISSDVRDPRVCRASVGETSMHQSTRPSWLAVIWAAAVSWIAIDAQKPPAALPADARSDVFAAGRARLHVEAIARAPHPIGSAEAEYVRRLLVQRLDELGLASEIQAPKKSDSPVRNVVARLKRTESVGPGKSRILRFTMIRLRLARVPGITLRVWPWCSRRCEL